MTGVCNILTLQAAYCILISKCAVLWDSISAISSTTHGSQSSILSFKFQKQSALSYISAFHQGSLGKSLTRPGWTQRTRCVHPTVRKREGERDTMRMLLHTCCSRFFVIPLLFFHDVLAVFLWKTGPDVCSPSAAISALHLALSPEADACRLWSLVRRMPLNASKSYSALTTTVYL